MLTKSGQSLAWTVKFSTRAVKSLKRIDRPNQELILKFMTEKVAKNPDPISLAKKLSGNLGDFYRFRLGDYRIVCEVQNQELIILILQIGHRQNIYQRK
jgi:mRNA interferase RelE/StbE